ncbi:hypothetical protein QVD99_005895 [Batrachochytrium dendrobatidis]|nr:hypothetical protein QVD99_005895 [Batrachochytrium dendrobatidis]
MLTMGSNLTISMDVRKVDEDSLLQTGLDSITKACATIPSPASTHRRQSSHSPTSFTETTAKCESSPVSEDSDRVVNENSKPANLEIEKLDDSFLALESLTVDDESTPAEDATLSINTNSTDTTSTGFTSTDMTQNESVQALSGPVCGQNGQWYENESVLKEVTEAYVHIESNIYRGRTNGKVSSDFMQCNCEYNSSRDPSWMACGEDSDCINRQLSLECSAEDCPTGNACQNRRFQLCQYSPIQVARAGSKGFGIYARENIAGGAFIIEYCGEVIPASLFGKRITEHSNNSAQHFYFMSLKKDEYIDASKKGNLSRYLNHSCDPNCSLQKWLVGDTIRIGLFALRAIPKNAELTFDYKFERYGSKAQECYCGAAACTGFIGGNRSSDEPGDSESDDSEEDEGIELDDNSEDEETRDAIASRNKKEFKKKPRKSEKVFRPIESLEDLKKTVRALFFAGSQADRALHVLKRLQRLDDSVLLRKFLGLHGLDVVRSCIMTTKYDFTVVSVVVEIIQKLPITIRNPVLCLIPFFEKMLEKEDMEDTTREAVKELLKQWSGLTIKYIIPKRSSITNEDQSKNQDLSTASAPKIPPAGLNATLVVANYLANSLNTLDALSSSSALNPVSATLASSLLFTEPEYFPRYNKASAQSGQACSAVSSTPLNADKNTAATFKQSALEQQSKDNQKSRRESHSSGHQSSEIPRRHSSKANTDNEKRGHDSVSMCSSQIHTAPASGDSIRSLPKDSERSKHNRAESPDRYTTHPKSPTRDSYFKGRDDEYRRGRSRRSDHTVSPYRQSSRDTDRRDTRKRSCSPGHRSRKDSSSSRRRSRSVTRYQASRRGRSRSRSRSVTRYQASRRDRSRSRSRSVTRYQASRRDRSRSRSRSVTRYQASRRDRSRSRSRSVTRYQVSRRGRSRSRSRSSIRSNYRRRSRSRCYSDDHSQSPAPRSGRHGKDDDSYRRSSFAHRRSPSPVDDCGRDSAKSSWSRHTNDIISPYDESNKDQSLPFRRSISHDDSRDVQNNSDDKSKQENEQFHSDLLDMATDSDLTTLGSSCTKSETQQHTIQADIPSTDNKLVSSMSKEKETATYSSQRHSQLKLDATLFADDSSKYDKESSHDKFNSSLEHAAPSCSNHTDRVKSAYKRRFSTAAESTTECIGQHISKSSRLSLDALHDSFISTNPKPVTRVKSKDGLEHDPRESSKPVRLQVSDLHKKRLSVESSEHYSASSTASLQSLAPVDKDSVQTPFTDALKKHVHSDKVLFNNAIDVTVAELGNERSGKGNISERKSKSSAKSSKHSSESSSKKVLIRKELHSIAIDQLSKFKHTISIEKFKTMAKSLVKAVTDEVGKSLIMELVDDKLVDTSRTAAKKWVRMYLARHGCVHSDAVSKSQSKVSK